jgi:peptide deformylase
MALLKIITPPDIRLRAKAAMVMQVDDDVKKIMHDMLATMYHDGGIGLAANQVGILLQIVVIDIAESDDENRPAGFFPLFLINPVCSFYSEETSIFKEACLSLPGMSIDVARPKFIKLNYIDQNNQPQSLQSGGFLARVIQHEMDHLSGRMIIDHVSKTKRDILIKKLIKINQEEVIKAAKAV